MASTYSIKIIFEKHNLSIKYEYKIWPYLQKWLASLTDVHI